jgi:hypothetical protein
MNFSDGLCTICKVGQENVDHLLLFCQDTKPVWTNIENIIARFLDKDFKLSYKNIICGILEQTFEADLLNLILSITRYIIWKRRNRAKYENSIISAKSCNIWINTEIKYHIRTLLCSKNITNNRTKVRILQKLHDLV